MRYKKQQDQEVINEEMPSYTENGINIRHCI